MQVPESLRKCVVFLGCRTKNDFKLVGTGFLVGYPLSGTDHYATYLVTAKHAIEDVRSRTLDDFVYVRFNTQNGVELLKVHMQSWREHPTSDLAATGIDFLQEVDHLLFPIDSFATTEIIEKEVIGIGDDICVVGLFTQHVGTGKNLPIVRVGNIAARPEEPVRTKRQGQLKAYLVECRSIGGLSGSPVFVHMTSFRSNAAGAIVFGAGNKFLLLGLMHGHWNFPHDGEASIDFHPDGAFDDEKLNVGIGVVVPAQDILDLLNSPNFQEVRTLLAAKLQK